MDEELESVCDARSLSAFVTRLRNDPEVAGLSLDDFLEQLTAFLVDAEDGYPLRGYQSLPADAWRLAGHLLHAGLIYE